MAALLQKKSAASPISITPKTGKHSQHGPKISLPKKPRTSSSEDSPKCKMTNLQVVSSQSKRKSPEPSVDEPRVKKQRKISPPTLRQGPSIVIPEAQKVIGFKPLALPNHQSHIL